MCLFLRTNVVLSSGMPVDFMWPLDDAEEGCIALNLVPLMLKSSVKVSREASRYDLVMTGIESVFFLGNSLFKSDLVLGMSLPYAWRHISDLSESVNKVKMMETWKALMRC